MRRDRHVIILAAGQGTRMGCQRPKALHNLAGRSLIERVLETSIAVNPITTTVVVGHESERIQNALGRYSNLRFVKQTAQLGTAHALQQAQAFFEDIRGSLVVLSGDVPRIRRSTPGSTPSSPLVRKNYLRAVVIERSGMPICKSWVDHFVES